MPWPSGMPPWQIADLNKLQAAGQLSGVNPLVLAGIGQFESGWEVKGAGYNSAGYGGFFGLGTGQYAGGNQETVASLEDPSEASFIHQAKTSAAAFNSYMQQAANEGYTGIDITNRADTIYQQGGNSKGILGGGEVSLIDQALGAEPNTGGQATQGDTASGGSSATLTNINSNGGAGSGSGNGVNFTGVAGVLQKLDNMMNPPTIVGWQLIKSLGTADIASELELLFTRAAFAIGFGLIAYVGFKQITGTGGGGATSIVDTVEKARRDALSQGRIEAHNEATAQRRETAQLRHQQATEVARRNQETRTRVSAERSQQVSQQTAAARHKANVTAKTSEQRTAAAVAETARKANPNQPVKHFRTERYNNSAQTGYRTPVSKGGTPRPKSGPKPKPSTESKTVKSPKTIKTNVPKKSLIKDVIKVAPK